MGKVARRQENVTLVAEQDPSVLSAAPKSTAKIRRKNKTNQQTEIISEVCVYVYIMVCEHADAHQHVWFCIQLTKMKVE